MKRRLIMPWLLRQAKAAGLYVVCFGVAAILFNNYLNPMNHMRTGTPRIYVQSDCGWSRSLAKRVAHRESVYLIPVDTGDLSEIACSHTVAQLSENAWYSVPLAWLPKRLVCPRLIRHGWQVHRSDASGQTPFIVAGVDMTGTVGASPESLDRAGLGHITIEELVSYASSE